MKTEDEKIIQKFLYGEMSDDEQFEFEERFIIDADLFEEIKVVEDELIEKYVRGWMDSAERNKFEQNFLTTNKRRGRVEFSRQMLQKIEEQSESVVVPIKKNESDLAEDISIWDKLAALFLSPKTAMAGALALIIGVFGVWVLYLNFNSGEPEIVKGNVKENAEKTPSIINSKPDVTPDDNQNLPTNNKENSVNTEDNSNEKAIKTPIKTPTPKKPKKIIKKTPTPTKTPPIQKTPPSPILALFSGTVRSGGKNNTLTLPNGAKSATLQLNLESVDYKTFQAQLTDADGNVIYQRGNLKARKSKVNFNIPAKSLKRGDYIIKLFGKNESGENESVADFQFRVNK